MVRLLRVQWFFSKHIWLFNDLLLITYILYKVDHKYLFSFAMLLLTELIRQLTFTKLDGPFVWIEFYCVKAAEPLRETLLMTKSLGILDTHLVDLRRMKGWATSTLTLDPPSGLEPGIHGLGIHHPNH